MKRSKIFLDLIQDRINVLQALQSLDLLLDEIDNQDIKNWVNNEINGYNDDLKLPSYRKVGAFLIGNVQVGYALYKNINIPLKDKEAFDFFNNIEVRESVSKIIQYAKAEEESSEHSLQLDANLSIVNKYSGTNGTVIRAYRQLEIYAYTNILGELKNKLISIFKELEKNYGNLDDLYIDFSDTTKKELVINNIVQIIYNDNSTNIGNNNEIKNSIVGDDNVN